MSREVSGEARFVYAGPGDEGAGARNTSGIALYVDGTKESGTLYHVEDADGRKITQHDFREHSGTLIATDATVSIGIGTATSKMVSVARIKDRSSLTWN